MAKLLILYYSRGGTTAKMAELITEGAKTVSIDVTMKKIGDAKLEELLKVDGIIIGSPTYYGGPASQVRRFIDESVKYHGKLDGKVGGAFSSSANIGGGNETTILSILQAMLIHGMVISGMPQGDHYGPVSVGVPDRRVTQQCKEFGRRLAELTLQMASLTK